MSNADIKMSDTFTGKVKRELYDGESVLADNVYFELIDNDQLDLMAYAINSHDALVEQNKALRLALVDLLQGGKHEYLTKTAIVRNARKALEQSK